MYKMYQFRFQNKNNPDFKVVEFDHFKSEAGLHTFILSVAEWINKTNANGLKFYRKLQNISWIF